MSKRSITHLFSLIIVAALLLLASSKAMAQGTAFTYHGRLTDSGNPADGLFDIEFKLFDTATVGTGIQHGVTNAMVQVSDGVFTVQLDFGVDVFDGSARFLEIAVRPAGSPNPYTILAPRQPVTATPYAIRTAIANVATNAMQLQGVASSGFIQNTTTQQAATNFNISGNGTVGGTLSAGAIGIGTTAPLGKLQVLTASDTNPTQVTAWDSRHVVIGGPGNNGSIGISYDQTNQVGFIQALSPGAAWRNLVFQRGGGNVGIGTSSPQQKLHVDGVNEILSTGPGAGFKFRNRNSTSSNDDWTWYSEGNIARFWRANVGDLISVTTAGSVLIGPIVPGAQTGRLQVRDSLTAARFTATEAFGSGVWGESLGPAGTGVAGRGSGTGAGVSGVSDNGAGVSGITTGGLGIFGQSVNGTGVYALSGGPGLNNPAIRADNTNPSGIGIWATSNSVDATLIVSNGGAGDLIRAFSSISGEPIFAVQNNGTTSTRVLQITGGSDLAEHFEVVEGARPGMVVAIDPENTGKLSVARGAYNRRVAGIISGAGNLSAGMVLPDPSGAKRSLPVALSGRVWVYSDATRRPIKPGDLLTTSPTAGHAMTVTNYARAQGAIIGKAMTGLKSGRGLVLALVSLQ